MRCFRRVGAANQISATFSESDSATIFYSRRRAKIRMYNVHIYVRVEIESFRI